MNDFYISEVKATGPGVKPSSISFERGMNIIHGASNTGKTYVLLCIDYLLGSDNIPFEKEDTGYDTISMVLMNPDGDIVQVTRTIDDGEDGSKKSNSVLVTSSLDWVEDGDYKISTKRKDAIEYGDLLLNLMGIPTDIKIISNQKGKTSRLTLRSLLHFFFFNFRAITSGKSVIYNSKLTNSVTADVNKLSFLLTGRADDPSNTETEEVKKAKKNAVIKYIRDVIQNYEGRRALLAEKLAEAGDVTLDDHIASITTELKELDAQIREASSTGSRPSAEIYTIDNELEQEKILSDRYFQLSTQFESDLERLMFISQGESESTAELLDKCPFCRHQIEHEQTRTTYRQATNAEASKIEKSLSGLRAAQEDTKAKVDELTARRESLARELDVNTHLINTEFQPKVKGLKDTLKLYDEMNGLQNEMNLVNGMLEAFYQDMGDTINAEIKVEKYDAKDHFDDTLFEQLSAAVGSAVKECGYPDCKSARLLKSTFDLIVDGKQKSREGQGYTAFLNSTFAFALMKFIEANGVYGFRMLMIDSPTLSLKQNVDTPIDERMSTSLFRYMIEQADDCQIIIAENELPEGVDYSKANMTFFTKKKNEGRYGFLESVSDSGPWRPHSRTEEGKDE